MAGSKKKDTTSYRETIAERIYDALREGGYLPTRDEKVDRMEAAFDRDYELAFGASKNGKRIAVALQTQETGGTAKHKVLWHLVNLGCIAAKLQPKYVRAFLVLSGEGLDVPTDTAVYSRHLRYADKVLILTDEAFIGLARQGALERA